MDENGSVGYLSKIVNGKVTPKMDRVVKWADALSLTGAERQRFIDLAAIAHLPTETQPRFARILDDYTKLRTAVSSMEQRITELEKAQPSKARKR